MNLTVLVPNAKRDPHTGEFKLADFVSVPYVRLRGVWSVYDMQAPGTRAKLARWCNNA